MSNVQVDLTNYKSTFGDYIDPDIYLLKITDVEKNTTRDGAPQLQVYYEVVEGDFKGQTLVERYPLDPSSRALFRTVNFLSGVGIPTPKKRFNFDTKALLGRKVMARVEDNEYRGNVSSQIASFMRVRKTASSEEVDLDDVVEEEPEDKAENLRKRVDEASDTSDDLDLDLEELEI